MISVDVDRAWPVYQSIVHSGGVAVWKQTDPETEKETTHITPYRQKDGELTKKPHQDCGDTPEIVITDPAIIYVKIREKRQTLPIRLEPSKNRVLRLTKGAKSLIRRKLNELGTQASYEVDHRNAPSTGQAFVHFYVVTRIVTLEKWIEEQGNQKKVDLEHTKSVANESADTLNELARKHGIIA